LIKLPVLREADLEGEELKEFRTGPALLPYCPECVHVSWVPTTNEMGCTWGDHTDVKQYFDELDAEEHDAQTIKCYGFTAKSLAETGVGGPAEATASVAGMTKTVPTSLNELTDDDWFDLADDAVHDIKPDHQSDGIVLDRALDEMFKRDHRTYDDSAYKYNYGPEDEQLITLSTKGKRSLFAFLREAGLQSNTPPNQRKDIITRSLLAWQDGLMASYLGDNVINDIFSEFVAEND
jgi:hypothetical protein